MKRRELLAAATGLAGLALTAQAQAQTLTPPAPDPRTPLKVWTSAALAALLRRVADLCGFAAEVTGCGSDVAMAGLTTGRAGLAVIGREATAPELQAFAWVYRRPPSATPVMCGGIGVAGCSPALEVFTHRDNPLGALDLKTLRRLFDGAPPGWRPRWRDLGIGGRLADQHIWLLMPDARSGAGRFFLDAVMGGSERLAWDRVTEAPMPPPLADARDESGAWLAARVAGQPAALAVGAPPPEAAVNRVAVAGSDAAPVQATIQTLAAGAYPLARTVNAYAHTAEAPSFDPRAEAFVRLIRTPRLDAEIAANGFTPLPASRTQDGRAPVSIDRRTGGRTGSK